MPGIKEKQVHDEDQSNQLCKELVGERHLTLDFLHLPIRHLIGERLEYPSLVNFIANTPRLHPSVGGCLSPPVGGDAPFQRSDRVGRTAVKNHASHAI